MVRLSGPDRTAFAQSLFSNDLALLDSRPALYACLLTPQGRFLHDFFITKQGDSLHLDCEGGARAEDLARRLERYRLRAQVSIDVIPHVRVEAFLPADPADETEQTSRMRAPPPDAWPDPRHPHMGLRRMVPDDNNPPDSDVLHWDIRRIRLGIPDGSRDMIPEVSTPIESGLDRLNGLSFTKGCYVGQELTARMHHRGLAKKHLVPLRCLSGPCPAPGADLYAGGLLAGQMRSSRGDIGLALVKDSALAALQSEGGFICVP